MNPLWLLTSAATDDYSLRDPPPTSVPPPAPTGPACADCGGTLRRIEYSTLNPEPSPLCWYCWQAAPGRARMAAKRARRAKRAGVAP